MSQSFPTRRSVLASGGAAATALAMPGKTLGAEGRKDEIRVGLVGCGGRGSGAARQALMADPNARLVAMGDAFGDRIEQSLKGLMASEVADRIDVPAERKFTGLLCHEDVMAADIDVVLLASPPYFRPMQMEKAVDRGLHIFCEKPVATDAPGLRRVKAASERAAQKGLNLVSGLCYRYHDGRRATMQEIHDGRIGDIVSLSVHYITGELWHRGENAQWSEMENQCRNWLYYTWLSGDHIAEQHIHSLDAMAWAMKDEMPEHAVSMGGRQKRTAERFGNVYDHFSTIYTWANGVRGHSYCRQQNGCHRDVSDHFVGTKGSCEFFRHVIRAGDDSWRFRGRVGDMYQNEHNELFAAIRAETPPINNGDYMCNSTMLALMGRMAAYTGQKITWEQAWNSQQTLGPSKLEFGSVDNVQPIAVPGDTPFE